MRPPSSSIFTATVGAISSAPTCRWSRLRWGLGGVGAGGGYAYRPARATWAHACGWPALALALSLVVRFVFARGIMRPVRVAGRKARAGWPAAPSASACLSKGLLDIVEVVKSLQRSLAEAQSSTIVYNRKLLLAVERGYLEVLRGAWSTPSRPRNRVPRWAFASFRRVRRRDLRALSTCRPRELKEIEVGGWLHDIGKIGIAEQLVKKPAQLDDAEMRVMRGDPGHRRRHRRRHPAPNTHPLDVRNDDERYDGRVTLTGLQGRRDPARRAHHRLSADTYDVITSDLLRPVGSAAARVDPDPALGSLACSSTRRASMRCLLALVEDGQLVAPTTSRSRCC